MYEVSVNSFIIQSFLEPSSAAVELQNSARGRPSDFRTHVESQCCKHAPHEPKPGKLPRLVLVCETSAINPGQEKILTN